MHRKKWNFSEYRSLKRGWNSKKRLEASFWVSCPIIFGIVVKLYANPENSNKVLFRKITPELQLILNSVRALPRLHKVLKLLFKPTFEPRKKCVTNSMLTEPLTKL